ncbi:sugar ABC transporter ATP-binding protein [Aureimonas fodinaquatilis]|uniref:Sugar ABC transporter ATP-binding protein n=1 Tax=Aureimonas fodinaquatilis TaxID=2565783 RepID=A0A5B0DYJ4_9HYPH|nr:sugar ABC transporter ATP-binding protein [Aureimonas fodinaquatilis]KAA0971897.1 sugar ABC transporter ATP-binding protein [Aureimonas fodinaquatilis]
MIEADRHSGHAGRAPLLRVVDIVKNYGGIRALSGVSLDVAAGEVISLAGENGSGKSTLIRAIAGIERPDSGGIFIDGVDWTQRPPSDRIDAGVQIIYQDFAPLPNLTAGENIWLPRQISQGRRIVARREGMALAREVLADMKVDIDLDRDLEELSVAHKQVVAIARALAHKARLLIMDEPTTALTHREVEQLFTLIRRLAANGMGFIFVSHKLQEVSEIAERAVVLRNGKVHLSAPLSQLNEADIQRAMTGREISAKRYERGPVAAVSTPRLEVSGLSRAGQYEHIGFSLQPGEILGLAGLMGAGRTALAKSIFGIAPAQAGSLKVDGQATAIGSVADALAARIAYVPEDRLSEGLFLNFSIRDNIVVRAVERLTDRFGWLTGARKSKEAYHWIDRLTIKAASDKAPVSSLSGGNQQRVVLAKWLASNPSILILNRPSVGVDVGSKSDLHEVVVELANDGLGVIVISDDLPELMQLCDRILVLRNGRIVAERQIPETPELEILDIINETHS